MSSPPVILLTALLCTGGACADGADGIADAAPAPLDARNDLAKDSALETVTGLDQAIFHDTSALETSDAVTDSVSQDCFSLSEQACVSNPGCTRIRGLSLEDFCAGRLTAATFKGCVSGGPDGGAAVIWARENSSGRTAQFSTTQLPAGWMQVNTPPCPDAGTP